MQTTILDQNFSIITRDDWERAGFPRLNSKTTRFSPSQLDQIREKTKEDTRIVLEFIKEFDDILGVKLEAWQIPVIYTMFYKHNKKEALGNE